jgi:hypothetical protein
LETSDGQRPFSFTGLLSWKARNDCLYSIVNKVAKRESNETHLILSKAETIVLFELVYKISNDKKFETAIEHSAENRVLWDIEAFLEKNIDCIFSDNYDEVLENARNLISPND